MADSFEVSKRQFAAALDSAMLGVVNQASEAAAAAVEKTAKDAAKEINKNAKSKFSGKEYSKSWKAKQTSKSPPRWTIYSTTPGLPHLLENPHDIVTHGKKVGRTSGNPHIKPVEDSLPDKLVENFNKFYGGNA